MRTPWKVADRERSNNGDSSEGFSPTCGCANQPVLGCEDDVINYKRRPGKLRVLRGDKPEKRDSISSYNVFVACSWFFSPSNHSPQMRVLQKVFFCSWSEIAEASICVTHRHSIHEPVEEKPGAITLRGGLAAAMLATCRCSM